MIKHSSLKLEKQLSYSYISFAALKKIQIRISYGICLYPWFLISTLISLIFPIERKFINGLPKKGKTISLDFLIFWKIGNTLYNTLSG